MFWFNGFGEGNSEPHLDTPWLATPLLTCTKILAFLRKFLARISQCRKTPEDFISGYWLEKISSGNVGALSWKSCDDNGDYDDDDGGDNDDEGDDDNDEDDIKMTTTAATTMTMRMTMTTDDENNDCCNGDDHEDDRDDDNNNDYDDDDGDDDGGDDPSLPPSPFPTCSSSRILKNQIATKHKIPTQNKNQNK